MYPFMSKVLIKIDVIHRQQVPPHLLFARPRVKVKDKSNHDHNLHKYIANIKIIPKHYSHKWDMWHWLAYVLGWLKIRTALEAKSSSQIHILAT